MPIREWLKTLWSSADGEHAASEVEAAGESQPNDESDFDASEIDLFNPFPEPVTIEITDVIDLHTIPPRDVKRVVEEYLQQAHIAGFPSVRIIHGKGIGVQREAVRTILVRTPFVGDWTDAPPQAGGWGATVVHLSKRP